MLSDGTIDVTDATANTGATLAGTETLSGGTLAVTERLLVNGGTFAEIGYHPLSQPGPWRISRPGQPRCQAVRLMPARSRWPVAR